MHKGKHLTVSCCLLGLLGIEYRVNVGTGNLKMAYDHDQVREFRIKLEEFRRNHLEYMTSVLVFTASLEEKPRALFEYGILRRLFVIEVCVSKLFELSPPDLSGELDARIRHEANAHLHSFLVNCYGIFDNIAWAIVELQKVKVKNKMEVSFFHKKFRKYLTPKLREKALKYKEWYEFLRSQRHPTAHRIPPYIVPYTIDGQDIQDFTPRYIHSLDEGKLVYLHPQILSDCQIILDVLNAFLAGYKSGN
ncbi:hypothetical protein [Pseudoalteromonas sp. Of7M-16]|uniref:hypothetical protein n=1 Tax=Pseudoalteromonas sp. Of7M-16 TaxID=2917756 RepID=UPI001EF68404|nr:hypothetical protein [Pseudoalteromonas sp. Of7M-16]MCG7549202.1 hypothetical protein [Pseudoalteromonas sp. Of7M-16]